MAEELVGAYGGRLIVAVLGVGLALICLIAILWIVRGRRGPSPFVRGGRNRQPRLQVLDAAAVDARRRLVLVRRDDVEHLIMIGGPSDIVIESRIPPAARATETVAAEQAHVPAGATTPAAALRPVAPQPNPTAQAAPSPRAAEAVPVPKPTAPVAQAGSIRDPRAAGAAQPTAAIPAAASIPVPPPVRVEPKAVELVPPLPAPASPVRQDLPERPVRPAPAVAPAPALDDAARLLDSARDRVFAEGGARSTASTPALQPVANQTPSTPAAKPLGSEFERILEEEMASNLAAQQARGGSSTGGTLPAPSPEGARMDPAMQAEVNRIFGDMSASRDK